MKLKLSRPCLTESVKVTTNNVIVRFNADSLKRIHGYGLTINRAEPSVLEKGNLTKGSTERR